MQVNVFSVHKNTEHETNVKLLSFVEFYEKIISFVLSKKFSYTSSKYDVIVNKNLHICFFDLNSKK